MAERICKDPECGLPHAAKGWCKKHHARENYRANVAERRAQQATYRAKHREEAKARAAAWRAANPERAKEISRRYYAANREKALEYRRRYREANRAKVRENNRLRKQRERDAVRDLTPEQWSAILDLFDQRCAYCAADDVALTQDHLIPLANGGAHSESNVVPACQPCNSRKGNRPAPPFHPMFQQEE